MPHPPQERLEVRARWCSKIHTEQDIQDRPWRLQAREAPPREEPGRHAAEGPGDDAERALQRVRKGNRGQGRPRRRSP